MSANASAPSTSDDVLKVVIYSDDRLVRNQIKLALGRKIASDLPEIEITEFATADALLRALDKEKFDAAVFDAEARPGGMGVSHQMRDEIADCPPVVLLIARAADAWMATWSRAESISPYPVDPIRLPDDVANVVRNAHTGRKNALSSSLVEPGVGSRHPIAD